MLSVLNKIFTPLNLRSKFVRGELFSGKILLRWVAFGDSFGARPRSCPVVNAKRSTTGVSAAAEFRASETGAPPIELFLGLAKNIV